MDKRKKIGEYVFNPNAIIGSGAFGTVVRAIKQASLKQSQRYSQIDEVDLSEKGFQAIENEVNLLKKVVSQNVVKYQGAYSSQSNYYIVLEYCDCDLRKYLQQNGKMPEVEALDIFRQICNGYLKMKKLGIIHRDLKPANILCKDNIFKLADFGLAKRNLTPNIINQTFGGTLFYMAPQILQGDPYTSKCDVWSCGIILYEILHQKTPWSANGPIAMLKEIKKKPLIISESFSPNLRDFLRRALQYQEKERLCWDEVFTHSIFGGFFSDYQQILSSSQTKFNSILANLRGNIGRKDIGALLIEMGLLNNYSEQLSNGQFHQFLRIIDDKITEDQALFVLEKMDEDGNGKISINELRKQLEKQQVQLRPAREKKIQKNTIEQNLKKLFNHLYKRSTYKNISMRELTKFMHQNGDFFVYQEFRKLIEIERIPIDGDRIKDLFDYMDNQKIRKIKMNDFVEFYNTFNGAQKEKKS